MKSFFILSLSAIALILEILFFPNINFFGAQVNVFLALLIASLFILPEIIIFNLAFWGGVFLGLFSSFVFGIEIIIFLLILFFLFLAHRFIFTNINVLILALFTLFATLFHNLLIISISHFTELKINLIYYIFNFFIAQFIGNFVFVLLYYFFINHYWDKIQKHQSRAKLLR